tara:strand:- start:1210 stop:2067 length:858 start_codon:yes stop_codon:yes gene_type:complete
MHLKKFLNFFLKKKEVYLIQSYLDKEFVIDIISNENIIGIDTEFDWRNTYFPKLSLLQISASNKILLIDCIKIKDLKFLKNLLEDKKKLIVIHSARSDTTVLNTNLKIKIKNVFDVQIAEKLISKSEILNYGKIVKKYFSVSLNKSETKSNWLKRPFTEDQLSYAADDVNFLIEIYKKQLKILKKLRLVERAFQDSEKESFFGNQDLYISRLKKIKKASKLEKKIFMWREKYAEKKNIPPSKIFKDKELKLVAKEIKNKKYKDDFFKKFFKDSTTLKDFFSEIKI